VPSGSLGDLRALAFVAVSAGGFLLAQPDDPGTARPVRGLVSRLRGAHRMPPDRNGARSSSSHCGSERVHVVPELPSWIESLVVHADS